MVRFVQYFLWIGMFGIFISSGFYSTTQNKESNIARCIIENGMHLVGTPYASGTLETKEPEKLVCIQDKFDCITFIEYVLALSLLQTNESFQHSTLEDIITQLRYRDGIIDGYGSRLHYFSEWILQQEKKGVFSNITKNLPEVTNYTKKIQYMSMHTEKYPRLQEGNSLRQIRQSENTINQHSWYYIPKSKVKKIIDSLENGDIIAFTTYIAGLDFVHTGIAVWVGNEVYVLHASEAEKKVTISKKPLYQYLLGNAHQSGIMVLRCK